MSYLVQCRVLGVMIEVCSSRGRVLGYCPSQAAVILLPAVLVILCQIDGMKTMRNSSLEPLYTHNTLLHTLVGNIYYPDRMTFGKLMKNPAPYRAVFNQKDNSIRCDSDIHSNEQTEQGYRYCSQWDTPAYCNSVWHRIREGENQGGW